MSKLDDVELGFLQPSYSRRPGLRETRSHRPTAPEYRTLLDHEGDSEESGDEQVTVSAAHLARLLRVCSDTLEKSKLGPPSRSATSDRKTTLQDDYTHRQPYWGGTQYGTRGRGQSSRPPVPPMEHYGSPLCRDEVLRPQQEWKEMKIKLADFLSSVGDVWQFYFPNCHHARGDEAHSLCHPLTDPDLRISVQQELVLARFLLETRPEKTTFRFLPWLSLIGYKLGRAETYAQAIVINSTAVNDALSQQCILLPHILRYFSEGPMHYLGRRDDFLLGSMLDFCYRRKALQRPSSPDDPRLESNCRMFIYGLWILNIIQTPRYTFRAQVQQRIPMPNFGSSGMDPLTALSKNIEELEVSLTKEEPSPPLAAGRNVHCTDLNIQALRNIGGLKIVWTACDRDHLYLDEENGILRLSWFNGAFVPEFYRYMPTIGQNDTLHTWELLLSHRRFQTDTAEICQIPLPPELAAYTAHLSHEPHSIPFPFPFRIPLPPRLRLRPVLQTLLRRHLGHIPDLRAKFVPPTVLPRAVPYAYFGVYEARIRALRRYMDTRRPIGVRNLWHDRRDSLSYYTFWGVILFGGASVLLGVFGLAVGIAQTVAAFRALG